MKCTSLGVLAAVAAMLCTGPARAESEAEYLNPGPQRGASPLPGSRAEAPAAPRARPAYPAMFAPVAAVSLKPMSPQQREERYFLKEAAATSRFETEASRLALGKSSDPALRSFAAALINHHSSTGTELLYLLQARGMAPPMLGNDQRKTLNRLAKLRGTKFDREYFEEVGRRRQQGDVQVFEKASLATRDPQVKAWVDRMLPALRDHATMAERLAPARLLKANASSSR